MFRSYYMERDVALIISPDGKIEESAIINEEKLVDLKNKFNG